MKFILLFIFSSLLSAPLSAGKITIEKSDSLIRNDVFDQKKARAEDYKQREAEREQSNNLWFSEIPPSCGLLKNSYLLYFCASNGRYYKGYESSNKPEYRELTPLEVKKLPHLKD